jgi:fatty acid desaturase
MTRDTDQPSPDEPQQRPPQPAPPTPPAPPQMAPRTPPQTPLEKADAGHQRLDESRMWNVVSYLITGPAMFGLIGWGLDSWLGTTWLVAVGIVGGMALSLYLIWFRYGTQ